MKLQAILFTDRTLFKHGIHVCHGPDDPVEQGPGLPLLVPGGAGQLAAALAPQPGQGP